MRTSLGLFVPFWVTTVHTVTDWFLYRHKNRFGLVWTYPQTVAAFAYVMNETLFFCGSIRDRTTWHKAANRPIFNFPTSMVPSGAGQFNKCSDSLHMVKKWLLPVQQRLFWGGEPATFLGGRDWTSVAEREVCPAWVRSSFSTFFSFFLHRKGSLLPSRTCRLMTFLAEFFFGLCPVLTEFSLQYLLRCCSRLKYKFFEFIVAFEILRVSLFDNI